MVSETNSPGPGKSEVWSSGLNQVRVSGLTDRPMALSDLLDKLPLGVLVLDTDRRIRLINQALEALTGFDRDTALLVPCHAIMRCNLCQQQCPAQEAREKGGAVSFKGDIINRSRRKVQVQITANPLRDLSGEIVGFLETYEDTSQLEEQGDRLRKSYGFGSLLGRSPRMEAVFNLLPVIAQTDSSVLITGETGTGKDLAAEAIHEASDRSRGPFIKVNCGALPEALLESELFGHAKGAFTGATGDKPGRIRLAHNGTFFLTEVGDLPLPLQVKLLTFLDDKVVYPLGSSKGFRADVRVIAATHQNLEQMVRDGRFREDLLYRLNVVRVQLPPLRERGEDVRLLLEHFLKLLSSRFAKKIDGYNEQARSILLSYSYPGNVRELRNIVEYAVNICQEQVIRPEHLPVYLFQSPEETMAAPPEPEYSASSAPAAVSLAADGDVSWPAVERRLIVDALIRAKGKRSKAAEILGWGRSTLWRKMKQHGLES